MLKLSKGNNKFSKYSAPSKKRSISKKKKSRSKKKSPTSKKSKKSRNGRPPLYLDPERQIQMYRRGIDPFKKKTSSQKGLPNGGFTFEFNDYESQPMRAYRTSDGIRPAYSPLRNSMGFTQDRFSPYMTKQSQKINTVKRPGERESLNMTSKLSNYYKSGQVRHPNEFLLETQKLAQASQLNGQTFINPDLHSLDGMHSQLRQIRENLQPLIDQYSKQSMLNSANQPYSELMEKSTGRLLKVQSERLIELLIDDLLVELVQVLNSKEQEKNYHQDLDLLKTYCKDILVDVGDIDVIQRQHHLNTVNLQNVPKSAGDFKYLSELNGGINGLGSGFEHVPKAENLHLSNLELKNIQDSLNFRKQLQEMGQSYGITQDLKYGLSKARVEETGGFNKTSKFTDDGPYENGSSFPYTYQLDMSPEDTMKIIRDQIMAEDKRNETPYLTKNFAEGVDAVGEKLMSEIMNEVLEEVTKAQDQFVNEIIKSELT